jgi:hypothetical protein
LNFKLDPPKQGKVVRQLRERSLYWGPDQIPSEHLSNLKESFKSVVGPGLSVMMFSEKMEEQLQALNCWKRYIPLHFSKISEVLDMILKWLTWVLFNTNTQTGKSALDVLSTLLAGLLEREMQLTEREAQILLPNIVERSGHNNPAIRESMLAVLFQSLRVYPRLLCLPMLLRGLTSKNKRSANCSLRAIAECFDRQVASQLLKAQKDVLLIAKIVDDKDVELRKAAIHTLALLCVHTDPDAFTRGCGRHLSKDTLAAVQAAATKLPQPHREEAYSLDASHLSEMEACAMRAATPDRRTAAEASNRIATPPRRAAAVANVTAEQLASPQISRLRPRVASPANRSATTAAARPTAEETFTPANASSAPMLSPSPISVRSTPANDKRSPLDQAEAPIQRILAKLDKCSSDRSFKEVCEEASVAIKEAFSVDAATITVLGEAVAKVLARVLKSKSQSSDEQCGALSLLQAFADRTEECRLLPAELALEVFSESLRLLQSQKILKTTLEKLNATFVKFLAYTHTRTALWALLEILARQEGDCLKSLVGKCIKKVCKIAISERTVTDKCEAEAANTTEVVLNFVKRHQDRLGLGKALHKTSFEILREVLQTARKWAPEVVEQVLSAQVAASSSCEERQLLEELQQDAGVKENMPVDGTTSNSKQENLKSSPMAETPKPSSPCLPRNALTS